MEAINRKYVNFQKAYHALSEALTRQEKLKDFIQDPIIDNIFSAGIIKHFELTYETAWKFLKEHLKNIHGAEVASPKEVFRTCYKYRIVPEKYMIELIQLADARNTTTHIYDQILAKEICNDIQKHYQVLGKILELIPSSQTISNQSLQVDLHNDLA